MRKIELCHVGEDYITVSYEDMSGVHEMEISGPALRIVRRLGESLRKKSFLDLKAKKTVYEE